MNRQFCQNCDMAHKDDLYRPRWTVCPACIRRAHTVLASNDKRADHGTRKLKAVVLIESRPETYCLHCQFCSACGLTGTVDAPEMEHSIRENASPDAFWAPTTYVRRGIEYMTKLVRFPFAGLDAARGWLLGKKEETPGITHRYLGQWKEENGQVFILVEPLYKFVGVDLAVGKDETVRLDCDHRNVTYSHGMLATSCPDCGFTETDLERSAETK